jgi:hypothetical protein
LKIYHLATLSEICISRACYSNPISTSYLPVYYQSCKMLYFHKRALFLYIALRVEMFGIFHGLWRSFGDPTYGIVFLFWYAVPKLTATLYTMQFDTYYLAMLTTN